MKSGTKIVRMYMGDRDLCVVNFEEIQTISAEPTSEPKESAEGECITVPAQLSFTFTTKGFKVPKAWRRVPVCKSRKRFIKKLMAIGYERNRATGIADMLKWYSDGSSYQQVYLKVLDRYKNEQVEDGGSL